MSAALDAFLAEPAAAVSLLPRPHLSASAIGTFARCPEQFRRRYMLGHKERPGAALIWGSADDYAHTQNFTQKIDSHTDLSEEDVTLAFAEGFDQAVERDGGTGEVDWGNLTAGDLKDQGVKLVAAYHRSVSPTVQPVAVQRKLSLEISGVPVPVIGRLDLETADEVVEWKVTSRAESKPKQQWRTQARLYQAATGKPLAWHLKARTKTPTVLTPATTPGLAFPFSAEAVAATTARLAKLTDTLLAMIARYGPDEPWPTHAPDYGWACDYCGFRASCAWWQGT